MGNFILITMKTNHFVTHEERKRYINSFYGSFSNKKKGMIYKFNNAHMFKNVVSDYYTDYPVVHPAKVENPDNYVSPEMLFYKHMWVDLSDNGIAKFVVPIGFENHFDSKYSYSHEFICKKFVNFLEKVYPDVNVEMTHLETFNYTAKDFVLNYFYQCMDFNDNLCAVECSSHRLLNDDELSEIYSVLNDCVHYGWHISQDYCEVCKDYHPDSPYHIEIEYEH